MIGMNIGIFIDKMKIGGAQQNVVQLVNGIPSQHSIYLFLGKKSGPLLKEIHRKNLRIIDLKLDRYNRPHALISLIQLAKTLRENSIDILHCYLFWPSLFGALAKIIYPKAKLIISIRSLNDSFSKFQILCSRLIGHIADAVTVVSKSVKFRIMQREKISGKKIHVIFNGINADRFSLNMGIDTTRSQSVTKPLGQTVFVCVANLNFKKGHEFLLRAFQKLKVGYPRVKLILVGDGKLKKYLVSLTRDLDIEPDVTFLGFKKDVVNILGKADVFVLPSLEEGMPNALIEAMAMGLPSITTNVGGNTEVNLHQVTGLVVPSKNIDALFAAMKQMMLDKKMRSRFALEAKQRIIHKFGIVTMIERNMSVYERILAT